MFFVIFRNDYDGRFVISPKRSFGTIAEAFHAREMSGDLVVDSNYIPVPSEEWLWDWEKAKPEKECYAKRMIALAREGTFKVGRNITN